MGLVIEDWMIVVGGLALLVLITFQILQGLRKIKFKGPLHLKVHKRVGIAVLVFALFHSTVALLYLFA